MTVTISHETESHQHTNAPKTNKDRFSSLLGSSNSSKLIILPLGSIHAPIPQQRCYSAIPTQIATGPELSQCKISVTVKGHFSQILLNFEKRPQQTQHTGGPEGTVTLENLEEVFSNLMLLYQM